MRHFFAKLKPYLKDYVDSWNYYGKLFELIQTRSSEFVLNTQWIYDMMVEFVYQFQGFCQVLNDL
jgi:hypothetical protein